MAVKTWKVVKVRYCNHTRQEVSLHAEVVYPAEWLPEQPPRILSHRCSRAVQCNLFETPACIWCGTNPCHDPFVEK
ncbi:MAG: hypothetical protein IT308_08145 [Anaerolineaceae bacterium]|nr:hypothetical protein [Anaerolineaceae bacterium]